MVRSGGQGTGTLAGGPRLTSAQVWRELERASFAVISYTTPAGEPRSSGVLYVAEGQRLYVVVANDSWKARHIAVTGRVAVTVMVRRGGILSLLVPIPPATISFHGAATVRSAGAVEIGSLPGRMARLLPPERRASSTIVEIQPGGRFVTYGVGVSLLRMRDPAASRATVPVHD
jgi:Pyridoxamine 5'-phosphate oxidase